MPQIVVIIASIVSVMAWAELPPPQETAITASRFHLTMVNCPQKIWPNYDWNGLKVIFVYPKKGTSWIWDAVSQNFTAVPNKKLPSRVLGRLFNTLEVEGQDVLTLNMEMGAKEAFETGVHEIFHHRGQRGWSLSSSRGTFYPLEFLPRLYRHMLFIRLKAYFEYGKATDLALARYWYDKWVKAYTDESQSNSDAREGSAQYMEAMAGVVSNVGCEATEEHMKSEVSRYVSEHLEGLATGWSIGLDNEGYKIGALATLILRFDPSSPKDWNSRMARGLSPVQILLDSVAAKEDFFSKDVFFVFQNNTDILNGAYGKLLDGDIEHWTDKNFIRVSTPRSWRQSTLLSLLFVKSDRIDAELMVLAGELRHVSPSGKSDFKLASKSVIFKPTSSFCPNQDFYVLIPARSAKDLGQVLTPAISGRLAGKIGVDSQGFRYLCVE